MEQELKSISIEIDAKIATTLIKLHNEGKCKTTGKSVEYELKRLARDANLLDPENVKARAHQFKRLSQAFKGIFRKICGNLEQESEA